MNIWQLPKTATINGIEYEINTDFRDVLEIIQILNNEDKTEFVRWNIAVGLFFEKTIPKNDIQEAMQFIADFISYGQKPDAPGPKLMDWEQDAPMIIADINKVSGKEVRSMPYIHWWTFLGWFMGIGEGQLSMVVSIRSKKAKGKKLEKWEEEYYKANKSKVDFSRKQTAEDTAIKEYFQKWL